MQKCDFNKIFLHWSLLKRGPRPWTWTHNTDSEKPGPWKTLTLKNIAHEKRVKITGCKEKQKKRTLILKNIYERLSVKMYPVLLFWFLEDISEVASFSTKGAYAGVRFQ